MTVAAPRMDSRTIVRMATGAALYGVLAWLTNVLVVPTGSLVTLRPAVVIPIFFGFTWGPHVGLFTGLVGNIIGDMLSGFGFVPTWDVGNGLLGMLPGFAPLLKARRVSARASAALAAAAMVAAFVSLAHVMRGIDVAPEAGFWPSDMIPAEQVGWPLGLAVLVAAVWLGSLRRGPASEALLWGLLGILGGMGTAAALDMPYNRMNLETAFVTEFLPATLGNTVALVVLLPPLVLAYEQARARSGR